MQIFAGCLEPCCLPLFLLEHGCESQVEASSWQSADDQTVPQKACQASVHTLPSGQYAS